MIVSLLLFSVFTTKLAPKTIFDFQSEGQNIRLELVKEGLGQVWGMSFLSSNELLFTEKEGRLKILNLQSGEVETVSGTPQVWVGGQSGLLDVQLHPQFSQNALIYFSYGAEVEKGQTTKIARAKLKRSPARLSDMKVLFEAKPAYRSGQHFGSRIVFDEDGFLYFSVGDRGSRDYAQDLSRHNGKIIRLHDDGRVPENNPFVKEAQAQPEIWSYGHRNPQGLFYDRSNNALWSHEHGPRGGDEINLIEKGKNYGWPAITYGKEYWGPISIGEGTQKPGMEQPRLQYTPSIAPSGYLIYSGKMFPGWKGNHFLGALALQHINRVETEGGMKEAERLLQSLGQRVRDLEEAADGAIYFSTDSGRIFRLIAL